MLHWLNEGERTEYGINYRWDKYSLLLLLLVVPVYISPIKLYSLWEWECVYQGRLAKAWNLRLRIRNPRHFLSDATIIRWWQIRKFFLFNTGAYWREWGWKKLIFTKKQIEDGVKFSEALPVVKQEV